MAQIIDTQSDRYVVKLAGGGLYSNMADLFGNESDDDLIALTETVFENSTLYSPVQYNVGTHVEVQYIWLYPEYVPEEYRQASPAPQSPVDVTPPQG